MEVLSLLVICQFWDFCYIVKRSLRESIKSDSKIEEKHYKPKKKKWFWGFDPGGLLSG